MDRTGDAGYVDELADGYLEEERPSPRGPKKPIWYHSRRSPLKPEDIQRKAQMEREEHSYRLAMIGEMNSILNTERSGYFLRDRRARQLGEVEKFTSSSIRDEHDLLCSFIGQMNWSWQSPYNDMTERNEAMAKNAYMKLVEEDWRRNHSAQGMGGPLKIAIPDTFSRFGMAAVFIAPDSTNEATGIDLRMLDPATIFPVFSGKRGLTDVFVIYNAPPEKVIGDFGDEVRSKVNKIIAAEGNGKAVTDPYWQGELIEHWDLEWVSVIYQGQRIKKWRHGYYKVPFIIKYGCFGMQGFTSTPMYEISDEGGGRHVSDLDGWDDRRMDLARKAQPFLARRIVTQYQEEKFGSRLMTMFRMSMNPPMVLRSSPMTARFLNPKIDTREGGMSRIGQDDELEPLELFPDNGVVTGLQALFESNRMTGIARGMMTPISPGTQSSGTALEIMTDAGYERWAPMAMIIEEFLSEIGERCCEIWLEHGDKLGPKRTRGSLMVPLSHPDPVTKSSLSIELTSEMVEQVGTRVSCVLFRISMGSLAPTSNALGLLYDKGLIDDRLAIELLRVTDDPDLVIDRIKAKKMDMIPIIEQYDIMDMYAKSAKAAKERGDLHDATRMVFRMARLAEAMQAEWAVEQVKKLQAELTLMDPAAMLMGGMQGEGPDGESAGSGSGAGDSGAMPVPPGVPPAMSGGTGGDDSGIAGGVELPGQGVNMGVQPGNQGGRPPQG